MMYKYLLKNLHWWNTQRRDGGESLEKVAENVDEGNVYDSLELAKQLVGDHGSEERHEVAEHGEGVVDDGAAVLREVELLVEVNTKNRLHPIVG